MSAWFAWTFSKKIQTFPHMHVPKDATGPQRVIANVVLLLAALLLLLMIWYYTEHIIILNINVQARAY